ncbi:hypothetical protein MKZ38_002145 [Zalerion maritima]|uniref:2EXR domain-containing protein n=1 Tax=Zalerion maritima TaxID=339359 RepID=A0AAD5WRH0_9PEZI|nr:hypothetical protein MKZ38_002145 [Zalerion maritima]
MALSFTVFNRLPAELRELIWDMAHHDSPRRIWTLDVCKCESPDDEESGDKICIRDRHSQMTFSNKVHRIYRWACRPRSAATPPLLSVCRESRNHLLFYHYGGIGSTIANNSSSSSSNHSAASITRVQNQASKGSRLVPQTYRPFINTPEDEIPYACRIANLIPQDMPSARAYTVRVIFTSPVVDYTKDIIAMANPLLRAPTPMTERPVIGIPYDDDHTSPPRPAYSRTIICFRTPGTSNPSFQFCSPIFPETSHIIVQNQVLGFEADKIRNLGIEKDSTEEGFDNASTGTSLADFKLHKKLSLAQLLVDGLMVLREPEGEVRHPRPPRFGCFDRLETMNVHMPDLAFWLQREMDKEEKEKKKMVNKTTTTRKRKAGAKTKASTTSTRSAKRQKLSTTPPVSYSSSEESDSSSSEEEEEEEGEYDDDGDGDDFVLPNPRVQVETLRARPLGPASSKTHKLGGIAKRESSKVYRLLVLMMLHRRQGLASRGDSRNTGTTTISPSFSSPSLALPPSRLGPHAMFATAQFRRALRDDRKSFRCSCRSGGAERHVVDISDVAAPPPPLETGHDELLKMSDGMGCGLRVCWLD